VPNINAKALKSPDPYNISRTPTFSEEKKGLTHIDTMCYEKFGQVLLGPPSKTRATTLPNAHQNVSTPG